MKKHEPKLVVIDSLIGCSGGRAFDENKSDFATPLYWLTKNNGVLFPKATILIVHHANKNGGFRGTSAIRDAVDETWALKKPTKEQVEKGIAPAHSRIITIEKSRSGRSGTSLLMRMEDDLSFSVADFTPEVDQSNTSPSSVQDRVLQRLRVIHPRTATKTDLNADPLVGGKVAAIGKALQRLTKRGLITEVSLEARSGDSRYKNKTYQAVLACGALPELVHPKQIPSPGTDVRVDKEGGQEELSTLRSAIYGTYDPPEFGGAPCRSSASVKGGQPPAETAPCPPSEVSGGAESTQGGQPEQYPRARDDERTQDELNASRDQAWKMWDV